MKMKRCPIRKIMDVDPEDPEYIKASCEEHAWLDSFPSVDEYFKLVIKERR